MLGNLAVSYMRRGEHIQAAETFAAAQEAAGRARGAEVQDLAANLADFEAASGGSCARPLSHRGCAPASQLRTKY